MFSTRTPGSLSPNPISAGLQVLSENGRAWLDLTASNPTRVGLLPDPETVLPALAHSSSLCYDADPRGMPSAREAVARYYQRREGLKVPIERLFLTASTSEAYSLLLKLLVDPGQSVLVPRPSYPLFDHLLALEGVRPVPYPLRYDGAWHIDPGALEAAVTSDTRAIIVVNPHNPTGMVLKRSELELLTRICLKHDLALISDEVFADYGENQDPQRIETVAAHRDVLCFSLSGLSKLAGLPQLKLGWILVNGPSPRLEQALDRLEFITDTYLSVGTPIQVALPALLEALPALQAPIRARLERNRAVLRHTIARAPGLSILRSEGGWSLVVRVPRVKGEEALVLELLESDGVLVHPGFFFDFEREAYLILSMLTTPEVFDEGLERLISRAARWLQGQS